jgi:hypothetical protein
MTRGACTWLDGGPHGLSAERLLVAAVWLGWSFVFPALAIGCGADGAG